MLLLSVILLGVSGCVSPKVIEMESYDPSYDQKTIASFYRNQAVTMREKSIAQTTAAMRYEGLFGPEADLVSGARMLASYYEQAAKEFDHLAEAHNSVGQTKKRPLAVP